ncbi:MAG: hypothetical protein IJ746_06055 [Ruminococcus sp.]|nr:hypothetical protein [Ruminococcus sp.]
MINMVLSQAKYIALLLGRAHHPGDTRILQPLPHPGGRDDILCCDAVRLYQAGEGGRQARNRLPLLLAAYGAFRFLEEWFRVSGSTSLVHLSHLWSVIAFIVGLSILIEMNSTTKKRQAHAK